LRTIPFLVSFLASMTTISAGPELDKRNIGIFYSEKFRI
jgi:hypothetical protein